MANKIVAFRVGLVIAAALIILFVGIFSIGRGWRGFKRTEQLRAHFHRINGLQAGAPVTLAGVNIGAVDSIHFPSDPRANYVVVTMWIEERALARVRTDSVASIATMGLLGDKFVEISPGSAEAPAVARNVIIASVDPIDYQALLQKQGTTDLIANIMAIAGSVRSLLDSIEKGHGLLSSLIKGEPGPAAQQLTLADIHKSLQSANRLAGELERMVQKVNRGRGLAGAMLSDKTNGRVLLGQVQTAASSMIATSRKLDALIDRFDRAQGTIPQLLENKPYAAELLANMRDSSNQLRQILHKVNAGQGTLGLAVNDPALYNNARDFLAEGGAGVGWGIRFMSALYSLTHPFSSGAQSPGETQPLSATPEVAPATDPALTPPVSRTVPPASR